MWGMLMAEALRLLGIKGLDEDEKQRRIEHRYRRQVASFRARRGK